MDQNDTGSSGSLSTMGVVAIAIMSAGVFFAHDVPWKGARPPATDPKPYRYFTRQDVDARLWQDPLSAVVRGRDDIRKRYPEKPKEIEALLHLPAKQQDLAAAITIDASPAPSSPTASACDDAGRAKSEQVDHDPCQLKRELARKLCDDHVALTVMPVMIQGGSYAESVESRRRARYATLAALKQMDFVPDDAAHIGYVLPPSGKADPSARENGLPEFVAYEWMKSEHRDATAGDASRRALLVLWLDEYVFATRTLDRLAQLRHLIDPMTCEDTDRFADLPPFAVVGPVYSSTLQDMAMSIGKAASSPSTPTFYSYGSTADDAHIFEGTPLAIETSSLHQRFEDRGLHVFRTAIDDDRLSKALVDELALRGVKNFGKDDCDSGRKVRGLDHVVLISEWDTLYGRSLPDLLKRRIGGHQCGDDTILHRYSYLRGLDGQLPVQESTRSGAADGPATGDAARADLTKAGDEVERPEGQTQYDYLRRLSYELHELDRTSKESGAGSLKAIGVVGSDAFDKLLILQALRSEFRDVIFFTTDLDARFQHPKEQPWARNLIVASSFGLELHPKLQMDILPFRDTYQTSVYLSTLIALNNMAAHCFNGESRVGCIDQDRINGWFVTPKVFEIGRTKAFDFSGSALPACDSVHRLVDCNAIQPRGTPMYGSVDSTQFSGVIFAAMLSIALIVVSTGAGLHHGRIATWVRRTRLRTILSGIACLALVAAFWVAAHGLWELFANALTGNGKGEPLTFTEGISIWPTEAIRLLAIFLAWGFVRRAQRALNDNLVDISERLRFEPTYQKMLEQVTIAYANWSWSKRFVRACSFRLNEFGEAPERVTSELSWSAQLFWEKYIHQGRPPARLLRVLLAMVIYFGIGFVVIAYFGMPNTPFRGEASKLLNQWILGGSIAAMLYVIFFVVDATLFCHQIIDALERNVRDPGSFRHGPVDTRWAQSTLCYYSEKLDLDPRYLDAWILMDFIAQRTTVVAKLVYFPFIIVSLMVLSRSQVIDNWTMPIGLVIVLGSSVAIVIACAILLRRSAEGARESMLKLLNDALIRLKGGHDHTATQVEAMIGQVRALRAGAFAPYMQQPLLKAVLLPLLTSGAPLLLNGLAAVGY